MFKKSIRRTFSSRFNQCTVLFICVLFLKYVNFFVESKDIVSTPLTDEVTADPDSSQFSPVIDPVHCETELRPGQYLCNELASIDPLTQQPTGCQRENQRARIPCVAAPGITCKETGNRTFTTQVPCKWTNGKHFDTALLLSIFLGFFGVDRFYLGYPALGLLKFSTLGFFFLGHLLDIILIASQVVGPADGSDYVISYFGPCLQIFGLNDETSRKPQSDWF